MTPKVIHAPFLSLVSFLGKYSLYINIYLFINNVIYRIIQILSAIYALFHFISAYKIVGSTIEMAVHIRTMNG